MDDKKNTFEEELELLIKKYAKETGSNIPEWILARYLDNCLKAFNIAVNTRKLSEEIAINKNTLEEKNQCKK